MTPIRRRPPLSASDRTRAAPTSTGPQKADPKLEFRNCGVFGERTDEIAARLDQCADGADALIVQGGINDIAQSLQGGHGRVAEGRRQRRRRTSPR